MNPSAWSSEVSPKWIHFRGAMGHMGRILPPANTNQGTKVALRLGPRWGQFVPSSTRYLNFEVQEIFAIFVLALRQAQIRLSDPDFGWLQVYNASRQTDR